MSNNYSAQIIFENELQPKATSKIPVGIHTGCKVEGVVVTAEYVDINFKDSESRSNNVRLWAPKGKYPQDIKDADGNVSGKETVQQAIEREERANLRHLVKVQHIVAPETIASTEAKSYIDLAKKISKIINENKDSVQVNLKLIFDSEGKYSTFPKYPSYIELCVEGQEPTLTYSEYEISKGLSPAGKPKKEDDLL